MLRKPVNHRNIRLLPDHLSTATFHGTNNNLTHHNTSCVSVSDHPVHCLPPCSSCVCVFTCEFRLKINLFHECWQLSHS